MRSGSWVIKLVAAGVLGALVTGAGGCGRSGEGTKRIVLLTNGNSPFWDACRVGLQAASKDLKLEEQGLRAVFDVNDGTPGGQLQKLRQFASQGDVAAVAVSAVDATNQAVADEMRNLMRKGVKVICVDGDLGEKFRDARTFYIGTDNRMGGRVLGTAARELLKARGVKKGSYAQFVGRLGSQNAQDRMGGFEEAVGKQYRQADRMQDGFDRTKARDNVRNAITNHADLVALVGIWSYNAPAIVDVIKEQKNNRQRFTIVTFDAEPIAIDQMGEKYIDAMVVQDPYDMGYQAVRLLTAMVRGDKEGIAKMFPRQGQDGGDLYVTSLKVISPDEGSPLAAEAFASEFGDRVNFMTLSEFKSWLEKYKLKGS